MKKCMLFVENMVFLLFFVSFTLVHNVHAEEIKPIIPNVPVQKPEINHIPRTVILEALCVRTVYEDDNSYNAVVDGVRINDDTCMPVDEFLYRINCVPRDVSFDQYRFGSTHARFRYRYTITCTN